MARKLFAILALTTLAAVAAAWLAPTHYRLIAQSYVADVLPGEPAAHEHRAASDWSLALISAARAQVGVTRLYDGSYRALSYPGGDIERSRGVCTDVVIRALRDAHGLDLQKAVHEDMRTSFSAYPTIWGLSRPDRNIDHRRVPNLRRYFERQGAALPVPDADTVFEPGDIVTWTLGRGLPHIGIVSDRLSRAGHPLILHNVGAGAREEDFLYRYPITGHYRLETRL